ncbi:VOC family protein [Ancylobacter radicis]|uniref:VOC family protein n=1 Tax=Ancylobacter radicis TaxID=2836179 RepID=A0ABS5R601_9HYPH|nr:VOC family protein [Ancylobacter radicis]MBS9477100.1 VOC family protein [Ancylobacter radicis]
MLSHINIGIADFDRAYAFYAALLPELGLQMKFAEAEKNWAGWVQPGVARPLFLIGCPYDGGPAAPGNGQMAAFLAADRPMVDRVHTLALQLGGTDEGLPGLRPQYHANYYGAYFRDPDGNKLCVCCHDPVA